MPSALNVDWIVDEYETYRRASLRFVRAHNQRILDWAVANLSQR